MKSRFARLIVVGAMIGGGLAMTTLAAQPARAADFCSDIKRIAAALPSGLDGFRGAQTKEDQNTRLYQATGWPQGALTCRIEENVNLLPKGHRHYVCDFPLTMPDKGKAATQFAAQLAKCVGGTSEPFPLARSDKNGGASTVDAKGFYA